MPGMTLTGCKKVRLGAELPEVGSRFELRANRGIVPGLAMDDAKHAARFVSMRIYKLAAQQQCFPICKLNAQEFHGEVSMFHGYGANRGRGPGNEPFDKPEVIHLMLVSRHIREPLIGDVQLRQRPLDHEGFRAILHLVNFA